MLPTHIKINQIEVCWVWIVFVYNCFPLTDCPLYLGRGKSVCGMGKALRHIQKINTQKESLDVKTLNKKNKKADRQETGQEISPLVLGEVWFKTESLCTVTASFACCNDSMR